MIEPGVLFARSICMLLLLGLTGVPLYLRIAGQREASPRLRLVLALCAVLAVIASIWWTAASIAAMAGLPLAELDRATFDAVLDATPLGPVLNARLAGIGICLALVTLRPQHAFLSVASGIALASSAWTGHAGSAEGLVGSLQRLSDVVHLLGAAIWFGALLTFVAGVGSPGKLVEELARFARTGTIIVTLLLVTGLFNAAAIASSGWSATSAWTLLLAVKLGFFAAMLGLAALNRWRLAPAYAEGRPGAAHRLRASLVLETGCAIAIVALVAAAGMANPGGA